MNWPRYSPGPVEYWLSEAMTQFINGALSGIKLGGLIGGGTGGATAFTPLGDGVVGVKQILLSLSVFLTTMGASGIAQFLDWHKSHPFPNPYPQPAAPEKVI